MNFKKIKPHIIIILTYLFAQLLPLFFINLIPIEWTTAYTIYSSLISMLVGTLIMLYVNYKYDFHTTLDASRSLPIGGVLLWGVLGALLGLIGQTLSANIEIYLFGIPPVSENTQILLEIINAYPFYVIVTSLVGPVMEEFVFRKVVFGFLYDVIGGIGAGVVSSLLFALMHFDGHVLIYSVIGLLLSYLYFRTKNIATPIIAHVLMNSIVLLLSGV